MAVTALLVHGLIMALAAAVGWVNIPNATTGAALGAVFAGVALDGFAATREVAIDALGGGTVVGNEFGVGLLWSIPFLAQSIVPWRWRPSGVLQHRDITYATPSELSQAGGSVVERYLQLDVLHRPPVTGATALRPVFVYIHGGAWSIGDKRQPVNPLCWVMVDRGWIVVNVNYRLSPRARYPDHLIDCKRAVRWVRENIEEHGGDP
ncbi:hypothetical protein HKX48_004390, partial [Thoreauomyces humboldtii]